MLRIRASRNALFLYAVLFAACFNDILRVGETKLSLFRVLVPAGLLVCFRYRRRAVRYMPVFAVLMGISFFQSVIFSRMNGLGIGLSPRVFMRFGYYYLCIVIVICMAHTLRYVEKELFFLHFKKFLICMGLVYLVLLLLIGAGVPIGKVLFINNVNDYGAMLSAIFPVLCVGFVSGYKVQYGMAAFLAGAALVMNDCKLALLGIAFQIFVLLYLHFRQKVKNLKILFVCFSVIVFFAVIYFLNEQNISVNGYDFRGAVTEPVRHILRGKIYGQSNSSVAYRANVMIVGMEWLIKTKFVGIGMGNGGILVRHVLGNYNLYESWMMNDSVSMHNALLEFMLEWGIVALIIILFFVRDIVGLLRLKKLTDDQIVYITSISSSVLWLQGPSGILTDYYLFMLLTYFMLQNVIRKKNE